MQYIKLKYSGFRFCVFFLLFYISFPLSAQKPEKFMLLDKATGEPITEATYQYADQSGISDEEGAIIFEYSEGTEMIISHVSYGEWVLSDTDLKSALIYGSVTKEKISLDILPVTIIALHPVADQIQSLKLNYQNKMAHDGGAVLKNIPAISGIRKGGNYGFDPVFRGFKYDQLNILINGTQTAIAACPNRMDPPVSQMIPNMTDRIEIIKGPYSLRYGNTLGGTINFISANPRFSDKTDVYTQLSGGYDQNGNILSSEGLVGISEKLVNVDFFASWSRGNDYKDGEKRKVQADFLHRSIGAKLGIKLNEQQNISLSFNRNMTNDADFPALPMDLRKDDATMIYANHRLEFKNSVFQSWNTTLYGTFVDHKMDNYSKIIEPRPMNAETNAKSKTYGGRTEMVLNANEGKIYSGVDFRIERTEGRRLIERLMGPMEGIITVDNLWQDGSIAKTGIFTEYQYSLKKVQLFLSGRLETNSAKISNPNEGFLLLYPETSSSQIDPALSLGGVINLRTNISAGLWLGRVQRSGSIAERYIYYLPIGQDPYEMLGNPQIKPEVNNQADLTFEWATTHMNINFDVFGSLIENNISGVIDTSLTPVLPNSPGVRRFTNIGMALKTGFEMSWSQNLTAGLHQLLSMAYTYGKDLDNEEPLPEIAPFDIRYIITGNYLKHKLHPEVSLRYVLKQNRISKDYGETVTPSFKVLDINISYNIKEYMIITAGMQNVLNEVYYEHLSRNVRGTTDPIYEPGRNIFFSFTLDFM